MRERRWETPEKLNFSDVLAVGERLAALGLAPAAPAKDIICYIEEWIVRSPEDFDRLDPWATEDVTLVRIEDAWAGDFFLLAGKYHTIYQQYRTVGTYCSVSHPWKIQAPLTTHEARAMLWLGFRQAHGFIRVRLQTSEVVTPGEHRRDDQRAVWLDERRQAFLEAINLLGLPIETTCHDGALGLVSLDSSVPFFCSWPDAFGPCQFEFNSSDPYEFLVPASRLASTYGGLPATVRAYLTGFPESALEDFLRVQPKAQSAYRCSAHCPLDELPEILRTIEPDGRLYATLCEFETHCILADGPDASAIVGIMGAGDTFQIEVRLNRAPLPEEDMSGWLEELLTVPVTYTPLPAFP